jgi:hypothetical protein
MEANASSFKAWMAISNALEEDLRRPGQRDFTPEDLTIDEHPEDSSVVLWWYRGATGYYNMVDDEVYEHTPDRLMTPPEDEQP